MPYTDTWDAAFEATPAGGAAPSTLDDKIRQLKLAVRERMNSILATGGKWDADDPIVVDGSTLGGVTGRTITISAGGLQPSTETDDVSRDVTGIYGDFSTNAANIRSVMPLILPTGITVTKWEVLVELISGSGTMSFRVDYRQFGGAGANNIYALSSAAVGTETIIASPTLSHVVLPDYYYFIYNEPAVGQTYTIRAYRFTVDVPGITSVV